MANPAFDLLLGGVGGVALKWLLDLWSGRRAFQREGRKVLKDERRRAYADLVAAADDMSDAHHYVNVADKECVAAFNASDVEGLANAKARLHDQQRAHQEVEQRANRALAFIALLGNQAVSDTGGKLVGHADLDFADPRRVLALEAFVNVCRTDLGVEGPPWRYTHDTLPAELTPVVEEPHP